METTIIIHQVIIILIIGQLQIIPTTLLGSAQTYRVGMFIAGLGHRTVVKRQLLPILDILDGVHPYNVLAVGDG